MGMRKQFRSVAEIQVGNDEDFEQDSSGDGRIGRGRNCEDFPSDWMWDVKEGARSMMTSEF